MPFMVIYFKLIINDEVICNYSNHKGYYTLSMVDGERSINDIKEKIIWHVYEIVKGRGWDTNNYSFEVSDILHCYRSDINPQYWDKNKEMLLDKYQYYNDYIFGCCVKNGNLYL